VRRPGAILSFKPSWRRPAKGKNLRCLPVVFANGFLVGVGASIEARRGKARRLTSCRQAVPACSAAVAAAEGKGDALLCSLDIYRRSRPEICAPKGLDGSAQGFNPGNRPPEGRALKGRHIKPPNKVEVRSNGQL
jgi:hypothetical protein